MSPFRILEILVCSLVTFLPYALVMIYPVRNKLRFGQTVTAVFTAFAAMVQLGCDLIIALGMLETPAAAMLAVVTLHGLFYLILVRASLGKKLFLLLGTLNLSLVITMGASLLKNLLFPAHIATEYHWSDLILTLVLQAVILLPYGIFTVKGLSAALTSSRKAPFGWMWLLNLLVTVSWLAMGMLELPNALNAALVAVLSGVVLAIATIVVRQKAPKAAPAAPKAKAAPQPKAKAAPQPKAPQQAPRKPAAPKAAPAPQRRAPAPAPVQQAPAAVKAESPKAAPQVPDTQIPVLQRNNLLERVAESDQFHRELLRHVEAMAYRLQHQQYDKLQLHVRSLQEQLSQESQAVYCDNKELNAVISYFIRMAGYCGTHVFTNLHVSQNPAIPTQDLTVMLGSLLDYALNSCKDLSSYDRRIYASVRNNGSSMYVNVEFTCEAAVQATGIGMNISREIAERYNGNLETSCINGIFKATAVLHPQENALPAAGQYHVLLRENLMERIAESDQFHRELLRHVDAMTYRLERQQYDKLRLHIHALLEQLTKERQVNHCDNKELNSVISYFIRMAGYCGAQVFTNMHISTDPVIPTKNLTVMLGNLLDNALEACKKQTGYDRRIYASLRNNGKCMYLNVEYTCDDAQADNRQGMGICSQIVSTYNGSLETSRINGICKTTAILRP